MESSFHGVPISATQIAPEAASSYRGIRAPITVDESDFEYSFSSKSRRNSTTSSYYSGSEFESEGYESGENEVEKDEGVLEEAQFVEKLAVSEPSLRIPDEELGQQSVNVGQNDVFRPFIRVPDGKMYKGSSILDDSDDSGSFLSDSGDELVKDESVVAHYDNSRPLVAVHEAISPAVTVRIPLEQKLHIPIAQISADSDDDSQFGGVSDEEVFLGIVRAPSSEVLHRIDSIPKVRVVESEGDENEPQGEKIAEMEFVDDLVISDTILGSLDEMEDLDVKSSANCSASADLVLDKGVDIDEEDTTNLLVVDEELDSTLESGKNGDNLLLDVEIHEIDVIDEGNRLENVVNDNKHEIVTTDESFSSSEFDSTLESGKNGDHLVLDVEIQEIDEGNQSEKVQSEDEHQIVTTTIEVDGEFESALESRKNGDLLHQGLEIQEIDVIDEGNQSEKVQSENEHEIVTTTIEVNGEFDSALESVKNGDLLHLGMEIQEIDVIGEGNRSEKVESENEDEIVNAVESFSSNAAQEISSVHQCVDIMESTKAYLSDSLFKDATLSRAIDAGESVSDGSESDHETRKEAVKSDRKDSTSFSSGEILSAHSREIDGQIVANSHVEVDADCEISDHDHVVDPANLEGIVELSPIDGIANVSSESNLDDLGSFLSTSDELEEASSETKKNEIEQIRVDYLGLAHRLGHLDSTKKAAIELAAQKTDDLDFSLSILVIGKTGVGKSATINSIFGETKVVVDAFEPATLCVKEIVGSISGVKLKVFDTPGLRTCSMDQSINRKILSTIKKLMQKSPPDVILYVDRLDAQISLHSLQVLKLITCYLGSSMWRKSIIVFTHGASIPPDGPHGCPLRYEAFVAQQSRAILQSINHPMVPVCMVENHPFVEKNGLHSVESWRSQFLLLGCSIKILSEIKNVPPKLLSSFLQSNVDSDVAMCCSSDSDQEETTVPPFRHRSLIASSRGLTGPVLGWDHTGIAGDFSRVISVQFTKNVTAAFNVNLCGQICVRTRCPALSLALVPVARAVFKKVFGQCNED